LYFERIQPARALEVGAGGGKKRARRKYDHQRQAVNAAAIGSACMRLVHARIGQFARLGATRPSLANPVLYWDAGILA